MSKLALLSLALAPLCACSTPSFKTNVCDHVVRVDEKGSLLNPLTGEVIEGADSNLPRIVSGATEFLQKAAANGGASGARPRLLLHVHGGMGSPTSKMEMADRATVDILREGRLPGGATPPTYPIFVIWPSGAPSSYFQHLTCLRQGRRRPLVGALTSPIYFVTDLLAGVARAPRAIPFHFYLDASVGLNYLFGLEPSKDLRLVRRVEDAGDQLSRSDGGRTPFRLQIGGYHPPTARQWWRGSLYLLTFIPKLASQVVVDGIGPGTWRTMLHRVSNLMSPVVDVEYAETPEKVEELLRHRSDGPLLRLIEGLALKLDAPTAVAPATDLSPPPGAMIRVPNPFAGPKVPQSFDSKISVPGIASATADFELVLVAHSMGAIAINQLLSELEVLQLKDAQGNSLRGWDLPITEIVYMAPACSVREAAEAVIPFVQYRNRTTGGRVVTRPCTFRVLTLHPQAEASEANFDLIAPRGSLLEWVDLYFTNPASPLDRRLGKWTNLAPTLHVFEPIREHMTVKVFGVEGDSIPCKHGEFNAAPFWRPSFVDESGPTAYRALRPTAEGRRWNEIEHVLTGASAP